MFTKQQNPRINYFSRLLCLPLVVLIAVAFTLKPKLNQGFKAVNDTIPNKQGMVVKDIILLDTESRPKFYNGKAIKSIMVTEEGSREVTLVYKDDTKEKISIIKAKEAGLIGNKNKNAVNPTNDDIEIREVLLDTVPQQKGHLKVKDDTLSFTSDTFIENVPIAEAEKHSGVFIINGKITVGKWTELHINKEDIESIMVAKGNITMKGQHIKANENGILIITTRTNAEKLHKERSHASQPVFEKVEVEPKFPGGPEAWRKYLEKNLKAALPVENGAPTGAYTIIAQFIVKTDGSITDLKALTKHGYGMEEEAIQVIKKGPKWIPAIQNGKIVTAYKKQPITFVISDGEEDSRTGATNDVRNQRPFWYDISESDFKKLTIARLTQRETAYEILSFRLIVDKADSFSEVLNKGKEFSVITKRHMESVNAGDLVTVEIIKAVVNGQEKMLPSLYYNIK